MNEQELERVVEALWCAQVDRAPCPRVTALAPGMTVADSYAVQQRTVARRAQSGLFGPGALPVGYKIGLTSVAVQRWLNVSEPDFGTLLDDMQCFDGDTIPLGVLLQPRAEAEIAFVLKRPLRGPGITPAHVIAATDFILPAIELIDSRIAAWSITYEDTIADNASSGLFVLGSDPVLLRSASLRLAGMALRKNGQVVSTGAGCACLGHPTRAVAWLANTLGRFGRAIEPGQIILSGALGPVTPITYGDVLQADIAHVGRVVAVMSAPT